MPTSTAASDALPRYFEKRRVAQLHDLFRLLGTRSRMTVFRHLRKLGYLTSFSDTGRWYTLSSIPKFDENGLWFFDGIGFSRFGTLAETAASLVELADSGATQQELRDVVRVRVHNALLSLVNAGRLSREELPGEYLYLSGQRGRAAKQLSHRRKHPVAAEPPPAELPPGVVLAILLEVIHGARVRIDLAELVGRLQTKGTQVTTAQVEATLEKFGIDKKRAR